MTLFGTFYRVIIIIIIISYLQSYRIIIFSQRPASTPAVCSAGTGTRWCRRPDIRECPCSDFWGPPRNRRSPLALSGCSPWRWTRSCSRGPDVRCSTTTVRRPGQSLYHNVCQSDITISLLLLRTMDTQKSWQHTIIS